MKFGTSEGMSEFLSCNTNLATGRRAGRGPVLETICAQCLPAARPYVVSRWLLAAISRPFPSRSSSRPPCVSRKVPRPLPLRRRLEPALSSWPCGRGKYHGFNCCLQLMPSAGFWERVEGLASVGLLHCLGMYLRVFLLSDFRISLKRDR